MAGTRKKKKKPAATNKIESLEKDKACCVEIDGWKIGDIAWGTTQTGEILHGEIKNLHDTNQVSSKGGILGKAVTLLTHIDGKYRTVLVSTLSENKIKKLRLKRS